MEPLNVVLYQHDAGTAQALAANLSQHFPSVHLTRNREEIRPAIARYRAEALILDVLANDELWTEALNQGAADLCVPWNTVDVVRSLTRERARRAAA